MFVYKPINRLMKKGWDSNCQNSKYSWLSLSRSRKDPLKHLEISWLRHNSFEVLRKTKYHKWICTVWPEIIENCIFHNMLIPAVLVHLSYTGIIRKGCNKLFLVVIICLTSIFSVFYLFIGHRGLKSQNKTNFRETFRSMCLILDNTAAS